MESMLMTLDFASGIILASFSSWLVETYTAYSKFVRENFGDKRTKQKINLLLCGGQESLARVRGFRNRMPQPVPNESLEATEHQS